MILIKADMPTDCHDCDAQGISDIISLSCPEYCFDKRPEGCPILCEIPNNTTNGDVIKALFEELKDFNWWECISGFDRHWWDMPYKGGEE